MFKILFLIFSIYVLAGCHASLASEQLSKTGTCGKGVMYRTAVGNYPVLSLSGTWHEMGRQYGFLARKDLRAFYASIHSDLVARGADTKTQLKTAKITYDKYSQDMKDLINCITTHGLRQLPRRPGNPSAVAD